MERPRTPPETYGTSVTKPPDFDAFWQEVWDEASRIPLEPRVEPVPLRSNELVATYEGSYTSLDRVRIATWYCVPRRPGPHPAVIYLPGYISEPPLQKGREWAARGYACCVVAVRGKLRSNAQFNPGYPGLLTHNIVDRYTYAYRGLYIDACRAVDFLLSRPEVDPERIAVTGSSQGGGLSIVVASMRREIKAACPGAPYLCGIRDAIQLTHTYPYEEINDYLRLYPERREQVLATVDYFDGINLAPRITCPTLVNIGGKDTTCPPETGYAVFNAIGASIKELKVYPEEGHSAGAAQHEPLIIEWIARYTGGPRG